MGVDVGRSVVGSMARMLGHSPSLVGGTPPLFAVGADASQGLFSPLDNWAVNLAGSRADPATLLGYPGAAPDAWNQQQALSYPSFIYGVEAGAVKGVLAGAILALAAVAAIHYVRKGSHHHT